MTATLFYTTGTGNSLWVARLMAEALNNSSVQPMTPLENAVIEVDSDTIGFVFPVHMWGVPRIVLRFLENLAKDPSKRYFAIAVNAGQVSRTLVQFDEVLRRDRLKLSAGYQIILPSNYIPWGGPPPTERQQQLFQAARDKIKNAATQILSGQNGPIEQGPLWQRIIFTALYHLSFSKIPEMDKGFWIDERCNACGACASVCPVSNIVMVQGKPTFQHQCVQCLACIQWCPSKALQLGKKTPGFERYHHPDVSLKDVLRVRARQSTNDQRSLT